MQKGGDLLNPRIPLVLTLLSAIPSAVLAFGEWQSATLQTTESGGDPFINRCIYRTLSGFTFSTNKRGMCDFSVEVNPSTMKVRPPGGGFGGDSSVGTGGGWQNATLQNTQSTGDAFINRCTYATLGGFRFSTNQRGICKFSVQVNPETMEVRDGYGGSSQSSGGSGGRWQSASLQGTEPTGDVFITRCRYRTLGGFEFHTNTRGICKISVQVNPETMEVR